MGMINQYDHLTDRELLRYVFCKDTSTPLEDELTARLERVMDHLEGTCESVYTLSVGARKLLHTSDAVSHAIDQIVLLTAPTVEYIDTHTVSSGGGGD